jgi:hypothetical protein
MKFRGQAGKHTSRSMGYNKAHPRVSSSLLYKPMICTRLVYLKFYGRMQKSRKEKKFPNPNTYVSTIYKKQSP